MSDQRVGAAFRAVRIRRGWRQLDVAARAGVSASMVSLIERGHLDRGSIRTIREVGAVLDIRIDVSARWRGGELDRMLHSRHAALTEAVARWLISMGWEVAPEVSFAHRGERGLIDLLAWHPTTRTLLMVEIKTEIVDVQEMIGTADRKTRLATRIARERGWHAVELGTLIVVADGPTNRRRASAYRSLLHAAYPMDGRSARAWLRHPSGSMSSLTFYSDSRGSNAKSSFQSRKRVRASKACTTGRR